MQGRPWLLVLLALASTVVCIVYNNIGFSAPDQVPHKYERQTQTFDVTPPPQINNRNASTDAAWDRSDINRTILVLPRLPNQTALHTTTTVTKQNMTAFHTTTSTTKQLDAPGGQQTSIPPARPALDLLARKPAHNRSTVSFSEQNNTFVNATRLTMKAFRNEFKTTARILKRYGLKFSGECGQLPQATAAPLRRTARRGR